MMPKNKRHSKQKKRIEQIFADNLNLHFHAIVYRQRSGGWSYGQNKFPRYWFQLGKEIIWDYPHDFSHLLNQGSRPEYIYHDYGEEYNIMRLICQYLNTPWALLYEATAEDDHWSLYEVLKEADRRLGKQKLLKLGEQSTHPAVEKIIVSRLKKDGGHHGKV